MSVDLESLRLLLLIEEHGSLGAAARTLGVSQPAASARLRSMESHFGLTLVTRSTRGSHLTADGTAVCAWAHDVMTEVAILEAGVAALSTQRRDGLRVASSLTIAEYLMPRWLAELQRTQPDVHTGLTVINSTDVITMVLAGQVRLGFIESPTVAKGLSTRRVGTDRITIVVSPRHPWATTKKPITDAELATTPLVVRELGSGTRETLDLALGAPPTIALEASSTRFIIGAAINGVGPGVVSEIAVRAAVADGTLVEVPVSLDLRRPLHAVWRAGGHLRPPASDLVTIAARGAV